MCIYLFSSKCIKKLGQVNNIFGFSFFFFFFTPDPSYFCLITTIQYIFLYLFCIVCGLGTLCLKKCALCRCNLPPKDFLRLVDHPNMILAIDHRHEKKNNIIYHRDSDQEFAKVGGIYPILHVVFLLDASN